MYPVVARSTRTGSRCVIGKTETQWDDGPMVMGYHGFALDEHVESWTGGPGGQSVDGWRSLLVSCWVEA